MTDPEHRLQATRRQPRQARSRLLVASTREACRRILQDRSANTLTAQRIADVAGAPSAPSTSTPPTRKLCCSDWLGSATFRGELQQLLLVHALQPTGKSAVPDHPSSKDPDNELQG